MAPPAPKNIEMHCGWKVFLDTVYTYRHGFVHGAEKRVTCTPIYTPFICGTCGGFISKNKLLELSVIQSCFLSLLCYLPTERSGCANFVDCMR